MYTHVTHHIKVSVEPTFLEDHSFPLEEHFVWAYRVWIENQGHETVQLLSRTWRITNSKGVTQVVKGEGVVGEKPRILPGAVYHYASGTPLLTPSGIMEGLYHMKTKVGQNFDVIIPAFSLDSPYETQGIH